MVPFTGDQEFGGNVATIAGQFGFSTVVRAGKLFLDEHHFGICYP